MNKYFKNDYRVANKIKSKLKKSYILFQHWWIIMLMKLNLFQQAIFYHSMLWHQWKRRTNSKEFGTEQISLRHKTNALLEYVNPPLSKRQY